MIMTSQFDDMASWSIVFGTCLVFLVKFSYCSKFHVNIIAGSGVMTIFFYKGLIKNLVIGNTPVWVLTNIWGLGKIRDTKFGTNISNEMLLNVAKCQGYSFYSFWVTPSTAHRLALKNFCLYPIYVLICLSVKLLVMEVWKGSKQQSAD